MCAGAFSPPLLPYRRTRTEMENLASWLDLCSRFWKNVWLLGKEERGQKVPCSHLFHLLSPCLCHSFPHFGRNNSHIYSWVILELFPFPHPHHPPRLVGFLPLLTQFFESIHTRVASSTSLWFQTSFLWRKLSLKPSSSTKVVLESKPEGGLHHQHVSQCTANAFLSESFASHVQWRHSTQRSILYLIKNKSCEPHEMELWGA